MKISYGQLSFVMIGVSLVISFFLNDHSKYPGFFLITFATLAIAGIIFSILSRKWITIIFGVTLNIILFVFLFFLILSLKIGEI